MYHRRSRFGVYKFLLTEEWMRLSRTYHSFLPAYELGAELMYHKCLRNFALGIDNLALILANLFAHLLVNNKYFLLALGHIDYLCDILTMAMRALLLFHKLLNLLADFLLLLYRYRLADLLANVPAFLERTFDEFSDVEFLRPTNDKLVATDCDFLHADLFRRHSRGGKCQGNKQCEEGDGKEPLHFVRRSYVFWFS